MIRYYIDTPFWHIRSNNTDWQYCRGLDGMQKYAELSAILSSEKRLVLEESWAWLAGKIRGLTGASQAPDLYRHLRRNTISCTRPDVIYSHGRLPLTEDGTPVVWFFGVVDPDMRLINGQSLADIESEYRKLEPYFQRATAVLLPTRAMQKRHQERFPGIKDSFFYAPFFLEHLNICTDDEINDKHSSDDRIRILFVGRDATRKGLDLLLQALSAIPDSVKHKIILDVVTTDKNREIFSTPSDKINWHSNKSRVEVQKMMRRAHIFVMPSRFETYGFVFLEAMAAGAVVIAPSYEAQRELMGNGDCGILLSSESGAIRNAIRSLLSRELRLGLAMQAAAKCRLEHVPEVVAALHHQVFRYATVKGT